MIKGVMKGEIEGVCTAPAPCIDVSVQVNRHDGNVSVLRCY